MADESVVRVGLLGFGTVGSAFAEVLAAHHAGTHVPEAGHGAPRVEVKITHVFNRGVERKRTHARAGFVGWDAVWTERVEDVIEAADVDVVVELMGGLDPAEGWIRAALSAGKHVVTANKQLIAFRGAELFALAELNGVQLLYGAAVAGGVPVIPGIAQGLSGDVITKISGILNGTCNFILSSMENGADYGEVLAKAQTAGYAEADPAADVDGFDARAKLCVLARLALHAEIDPEQIPTQTIAAISAVDFAYAKELGCTVRQVSRAEIVEGVVSASVGPMLVPKTSPIAYSRGTQNMVVTSGRFGGDVVFSGHGAGGHPTAVAVMSDVRAIAETSAQVRLPATKMKVVGDVLAPHYLRFVVADRPGIVAAIAGALARVGANIDAILQHRGFAGDRLPFVVTTEPSMSAWLKEALVEMETFDFMLEPPLCLQILVVDDRDTD
jgi:homoserine dehydrogenase